MTRIKAVKKISGTRSLNGDGGASVGEWTYKPGRPTLAHVLGMVVFFAAICGMCFLFGWAIVSRGT